MYPLYRRIPRWLVISLLVLAVLVSAILLWRAILSSDLGRKDLIGYWSATYLFRTHQNPYDPQLLDYVQHVQMNTGWDATIMAWNPPTLFVILLPLSLLPFTIARFVLVIINLAIVLTTVWILARLFLPADDGRFALKCVIFAIAFPQVLSGIYMGQVTFFVFLGLVFSMVLIKRGKFIWAGVVLILVTIKPHLVLLSLIYLLVYMAQHRQLRGWLGLSLAGIFCALVLFLFRPVWISDLIGEMSIAPVNWETPTIGGLLSYLHITEITRYMIILLLPLPFILLKYKDKIKLETAIAVLTLVTIPTTFFGWGYDQIMLLIPIIQLFAWMSRSKQKTLKTGLMIVIVIALMFNYYQRSLTMNEVVYVWVPLFWLLLFGITWFFIARVTNNHADPPAFSS